MMASDELRIRDALPDDHAVIAEYNDSLARETEHRSLDPALIKPGVKALLADDRKGRYWLAEVNDKVIGQIMVTYEWSDWRNGCFWWIQSVYVHRDHRRNGVFSALYRHVESLAIADSTACGIRLYVEEQNIRAEQTYRSLGMQKPGYNVMESEFERGNH